METGDILSGYVLAADSIVNNMNLTLIVFVKKTWHYIHYVLCFCGHFFVGVRIIFKKIIELCFYKGIMSGFSVANPCGPFIDRLEPLWGVAW